MLTYDIRSILCLGGRVWKKYTKGKKKFFPTVLPPTITLDTYLSGVSKSVLATEMVMTGVHPGGRDENTT